MQSTHFKKVKDLYSDWANQYDESSLIGAPYLVEEGVWIREVEPKQGEKILDIGCGTGRITSEIYKFSKNITGVDISPEMLNIAKIKLPNIEFIEANIEDGLPFDDISFDKVISSLTFQFLSDIKHPLEEIYRVLNKGGLAFISDFVVDAPMDWSDIEYRQPKKFKGSISSISKFRKLTEYVEVANKVGFKIVGVKPLRVKENLKEILTEESYQKVVGDWASVLVSLKK